MVVVVVSFLILIVKYLFTLFTYLRQATVLAAVRRLCNIVFK